MHERHRRQTDDATDTIAVPLADHNVVTFGYKLGLFGVMEPHEELRLKKVFQLYFEARAAAAAGNF